MEMKNYYSKLIGKKVKAVYLDDGKTKVIKGILNGATDNHIIIDEVIIGLGPTFVSCHTEREAF